MPRGVATRSDALGCTVVPSSRLYRVRSGAERLQAARARPHHVSLALCASRCVFWCSPELAMRTAWMNRTTTTSILIKHARISAARACRSSSPRTRVTQQVKSFVTASCATLLASRVKRVLRSFWTRFVFICLASKQAPYQDVPHSFTRGTSTQRRMSRMQPMQTTVHQCRARSSSRMSTR